MNYSIAMNRALALCAAITVAAALAGCSTGKKNVLFLTKTTLGVDVDSKPPTLDIGYARKEATLSPRFKDGDVLPQMASFTGNAQVLKTAIGQSFATGNAAVIMSKYLGTANAPDLDSTGISLDEITDSTASAVPGSISDAKRYYFGTDTTFGFRVTFGLETGGYPDSVSIAYKRKELAFVPLVTHGTGANAKVSLPSLLATVGIETDTTGFGSAGAVFKQFYATGLSASYLASQPEVRNTVGLKLVEKTPELVQALENVDIQASREAQFLDAQSQERTSELLDKVDALDDPAAIALFTTPPVADDAMTAAVIAASTPPGGVTTGGQAKQLIKRRIVLHKNRTPENLDAWDAALTAP